MTNGSGTQSDPQNQTQATNAPIANTSVTLTSAEVAKHSVFGDCWMIISDKVYDMSDFTNHPGGTAYVPYCGTDATVGFETKGGRGAHSVNAHAMLDNYYIGDFGQTIAR